MTKRLVSKKKRPATPGRKKISLALQGGGSHGAFTWGVLDALLEDPRIDVEGVSGTSAGAMNATATIQGLLKNGNVGARKTLRDFWEKIGEKGKKSLLQFNPMDKMTKRFEMSNNPIFKTIGFMNTLLSPYELNPQNIHPLQDLIMDVFDFEALKKSKDRKLFLCATHVATGKLKIFTGKEITPEALLASACVPSLFQAIEIEGEFYWDGGFIGNPAIYPLIYHCDTPDILIIQIRRVHDPIVPRTMREINNRLGEITQNACLTREMRSIAFISKLIDDGVIAPGALKRLYVHLIRDDAFFGTLDRASGFSADPDFLEYLFEQGRRCGKKWLTENFDAIGKKTTARLEEDFVS